MSSLRKLLQQEAAQEIVEEVEIDGDRYVLKGRPDANLYWKTIMASDRVCEKHATHWNALWPDSDKFTNDIVREILGLHATLQPDEGEQPYDLSEIAEFSVRYGPKFIQLTAASARVMGLAEKLPVGQDPTMNAALGNSSSDQAPDSSKPVSQQAGTTQSISDD